jgi:hypothetical protein
LSWVLANFRLVALLGVCVALSPVRGHTAEPSLAAQCVQVHNDDTLRGYEPSLRRALLNAYSRLFPGAPAPPPETQLRAARIRCMDNRLLACFVGANLPCQRMSMSPYNRGVDEFCRLEPDVDVVPAFAAGHDTIFTYSCVAGQPTIIGRAVGVDRRGFAARLWAPLD